MTEAIVISNQTEVCGICYQTATRKCSACKSIFYCSPKHQKSDWKRHRKHCTSFKVSEDSILGRHYIATRNIDVGEIIVEELQSLVSAPLKDTCPLCLNCYSLLNILNAQSCEKCGWPLCNKCNIHGIECEFTIKHRGTKISINNFEVVHPTYKCVGVIRVLALRDVNPDAYKKFMSLESHCDDNNEDDDDDYEKIKKRSKRENEFLGVAQFVKDFFKLDGKVKLNDIVKILGIIQINGHEVPTSENPHVAVYEIASYFEHNCHANCTKSFTENGGIVIRAGKTILKGQHITLCYTDALWGVTNRRHHLLETKLFNCMCERCRDPTEFGTMFNALKCTNGTCSGLLLPSSFTTTAAINMNTNAKFPDYICNKCHESIMRWDNAEIILESIGIELTTMLKDDIDACHEFIKRNSKIIHDYHFYMVDVKLALVQLIGHQNGGLPAVNDDILSEKIFMCKKLNEILRTIVPAENRIRGLILFEMHAGLAEYGRRQGRNELREMLMLSREALIEAYELLRYEPEILPEGKIARIAKQNIHEMDKIIRTICESELNPM